jgi:hypothetical protein
MQTYCSFLMALKVNKRAKANSSPTKYEQEVLRLLTENNALLKENNEMLKFNRESIKRIEEYTRGIKANTNSIR